VKTDSALTREIQQQALSLVHELVTARMPLEDAIHASVRHFRSQHNLSMADEARLQSWLEQQSEAIEPPQSQVAAVGSKQGGPKISGSPRYLARLADRIKGQGFAVGLGCGLVLGSAISFVIWSALGFGASQQGRFMLIHTADNRAFKLDTRTGRTWLVSMVKGAPGPLVDGNPAEVPFWTYAPTVPRRNADGFIILEPESANRVVTPDIFDKVAPKGSNSAGFIGPDPPWVDYSNAQYLRNKLLNKLTQ